MTMANEKPAPKWRNFAAWSAVGALFTSLVMLAAIAWLRQDPEAIFESAKTMAMLGLAVILAAALIGVTSLHRPITARTLASFAIWNGMALGLLLLVVSIAEAGAFREAGGSEVAAFTTGAVFLVIGLMICAGLANPNFGASYLNVEDAGELCDQRPILWRSAAAMAAWGLMLVVLAASQPSGPLSPAAALAAALSLFVISAWLTLATWRHMDELARRLSTESGNMSYYLVVLGGGGWAMLAHLGFVSAPAPLHWLTMITGLVLLASFIVAGRRGLLVQH